MNRVYYSLRKIAYNNKFRFTNANKNKNSSKRRMSTEMRGGGGGGGPNYDYLIPAVLVGCYMVYSARPPGGYDVKIHSLNLLTNN